MHARSAVVASAGCKSNLRFVYFAGDRGEVCPETAVDNIAGMHSGHTLVSIYGRAALYHVFTFGKSAYDEAGDGMGRV
jgi:hypothetical protein